MTSQVLTEQEKTRRAELNADTRQALQMGLSNTDDPVEVLPAALARVQQHSVAEARRAAENVARSEVQKHAIKEARRIAQETARNEIRALLQKAIADGDEPIVGSRTIGVAAARVRALWGFSGWRGNETEVLSFPSLKRRI